LFSQYLIDGLTLGALYGAIAISYALIFGVIRIINFAQGEIITIGCFGGLGVYLLLPGIPLPILVPLMVLGAMITACAAGLLMERFMFRPLLRKDSPALLGLIASLGVSIFIQNILRIEVATSDVPFPELVETKPLVWHGMQISPIQLILIVVCILISVGTYFFVEKTRLGLSILAVRDNREMAESTGISVQLVLRTIFLTASAVAAGAGILMGLYYGVARYDMGFLPGIKGFTASIMGGVGNVRGAMMAGVILGLIESLGSAYIASGYKDAFAFILLIIVLIFKPKGLLGSKA